MELDSTELSSFSRAVVTMQGYIHSMNDSSPSMSSARAPSDTAASSGDPPPVTDRERLLLAVMELCERANETQTGLSSREDVQDVLQEIFLNLISTAEHDLRRRLAEKLSDSSWAPHGLVTVLALDDIEIARPVIARSSVLTHADLLRVLIEATLEHQIEVARRPNIPASVVDEIIHQSRPLVMTALADNITAEVGMAQLTRMVAASRRLAGLRSPLVRHPNLTVDMAYALYAWVGETLRGSIAERFRVDEDKLQAAVDAVVRDHRAGEHHQTVSPTEKLSRVELALEHQLIMKLDAAGQLRPGYLLRALREGRLSLFKAALSRLGGFDREIVDAAIDSGRSDLLALACVAVGIDRSVFPTLHRLVADLMGRRTQMGGATPAEIANAFANSPEHAAQIFAERVARYS